ncbi:MAG: hypothetical protein AAF725_27885, partial [Acidobacteriota bacterium]
YQNIFKKNQEKAMRAMGQREIDWLKLRRFMLYGFSDAAGIERKSHLKGSPYHRTQRIIRKTLERAFRMHGASLPVVVLAQSLGGHVMSNYIWDAQQSGASQGTWRYDPAPEDQALEDFLRLKALRYFVTTGCNIPIFVSGFPKKDIEAIQTSAKGYAFLWRNFYDPDDVLGWPLEPLSRTYRDAVHRDYAIDAAGSLWGLVSQSWNPFSHRLYWKDQEVLESLCRDVRGLL